MLGNIDCDRDRHELLNILCEMCSRQKAIPRSMHMVNCLEGEFDGGQGKAFKGKHKGRAVAIKIPHICLTSDLDKCLRVSILALRVGEFPLMQ